MKSKLIYLTIFLIEIYCLTEEKHLNKIIIPNNDSEITLLIRGSGEQYIFNNKFSSLPNEVYVNGNKTYFINNQPKIFLKDELNMVTLKWKNKISSCNYMFYSITNIIELDLSKFDASSVKSMNYMFRNCSFLKSINLTNFNTSQVTESCSMFNGCSSLLSLDLSSFNTAKNENMGHFFYRCSSLTFLNLSNFNTSKVKYMDNMFKGCTALVSLDLYNFDFSSINNINGMFSSCNKLEYINLNNSKNFLNNADNSKIFKESAKNLVICINGINNEDINKAECGTIDCSYDWKKNQKKVDAYNYNCILNNQCNLTDNKYEFENKCYKECQNDTHPINYICQRNNYQTTILTVTTSNILEIRNSTEIIIPYTIGYSVGIKETRIIDSNHIEYIYKNICNIINFFNNECKNKYKNREEQIEYSNYIVQQIMQGTLNELLNEIINENRSLLVQEEKEIYQITTLSNMKDITNFTSINFGYCENILKSKYGLKETEELIIFKIEHIIEGYKIPIIEYVIFNQNGTIKLNLEHCNNISIKYNIPVTINEKELDKYNSTSNYYTDECSKAKSEDGVDMTIYDRKYEYNKKNMSLCELNCTYKGYNISTLKAECECPPKIEIGYSEGSEDLNKLEANKKSTNFYVTQCFNLFKEKDNFGSNCGFIILLLILALFLIIFIIFCTRGKSALINEIDKIITKKTKDEKEKNKNDKNSRKKSLLNNNNDRKNKSKNKKINNKNKNNILNRKKKFKKGKKNDIITTIINNNNDNNGIFSKKNLASNSVNIITNNHKKKEIFQGKLNDYELNSMDYNEAFIYDKRTYCGYYLSLIKAKQILIFSFCSFDDYNSGIIKKYILFLYFAFHYTSSAVFFTDKIIHQIVEDKGDYNFSFQIKFIIFSTIIS